MRLAVPAKFREVLEACYGPDGSQLVLVPGDQCIRLMPHPVWDEFAQELEQISMLNPDNDRLRTFLYGLMAECELDAQNRIRLTPALCAYIGLERDAVVVGRGNEMSIWREDTWKSFCQDMGKNYLEVLRGIDRSRMAKM